MTSIVAAGEAVGGGLRARLRDAAWIHSAPFDILLLIFAPLVTLPIMAGFYFSIPLLALGGGLTLAFAHYFSTIAFYFWEENKAYHRLRWQAFYAGPILLVGTVILLFSFDVPYVVQAVLITWNTYHVARQNNGILAIYRSRAGVADPAQRTWANRSILAVSFFLVLWNIETNPSVAGLLGLVADGAGTVLRIVAAGTAAWALGGLALALWRRQESLGLPEGLFLAASVVFFWPYLFIRTSEPATFVMLLPHYVQYLALVWLLHRRKFARATAGAARPLLWMSRHLWVLVPVLFGAGAATQGLRLLAGGTDYLWYVERGYLAFILLHFYLDGLIWSFRRPHVRQTILPFLLRREPPVPA